MNKGARHNVYAYIVNEDGQVVSRYSDDGEPQELVVFLYWMFCENRISRMR